ncbi:TetR/AcrR family transcriptional regulator [Streptomyces sp. NBC_00237]|uniref:TetR/AcrR family transcriptional regulator n=1 Tax=Streptomyces sp. NBC_00237 TaxID=2975687 RepID=UPI002251583D|nr:TetR/AcrR family transcriptional regulator [Streptomyces sp. NBC_00237]MCX5205533.1 TetR/AcrR family transcriptional regulator [Streptomyces sp. NBC_00237]
MAHVTAAERRPQLVEAAIALMSREGVAAGSTRAIAAELGVAQATVHYTFGTKEDLYRAVMEQLTQNLVVHVEKTSPTNGGFAESLTVMATALWHTVREQRATHQLLNELTLFALRTPKLHDVVHGHHLAVERVTARLIEEVAERTGHALAVPATVVAHYFLGAFDGLSLQLLTLPDEEAERHCLHALVSSTVVLAGGTPDEVTPPAA